jgi:hypothetical protein
MVYSSIKGGGSAQDDFEMYFGLSPLFRLPSNLPPLPLPPSSPLSGSRGGGGEGEEGFKMDWGGAMMRPLLGIPGGGALNIVACMGGKVVEKNRNQHSFYH